MKFSFITIFPNLIEGYFSNSILKRAIENKKIEVSYYNPRDYTKDKHKRVDAPMVGGGAGMLMTPQPLFDTLENISKGHTILLSPVGKPFKTNDAKRLSKKEHIILISGRYEGIDERIIETKVDEVFSIGDFILTGGELGSLVVCDAISRQIDGVLGNINSLEEESFEEGVLEAPFFTKPKEFNELMVISEFLKGNHSKITLLKKKLALLKTCYFRPDLYQQKRQNNEK